MPYSQSTGSKDLSPIGSFGTGIGESLSFGQATYSLRPRAVPGEGLGWEPLAANLLNSWGNRFFGPKGESVTSTHFSHEVWARGGCMHAPIRKQKFFYHLRICCWMILIYLWRLRSELQSGLFGEAVFAVIKSMSFGARQPGFVCRFYHLPAGWVGV